MIKEFDNIKLINADCMDIMKEYPDNYFDLAIVDPPYGIRENGSTNKSRGKLAKAKDYKAFAGNDLNPPSRNYFEELKRISKNIIVFGANHFIENIRNANSSAWIVWDKKTGNSDFADCELAYTSFKTAVRKFSFQWSGMLQEDMKNKEIRIHPTQKPVALYSWIYAKYAKENMKIIDTHLGSGSNAIASHYAKMSEFVGIELDEDYFNAACKRVYKETRQQELF